MTLSDIQAAAARIAGHVVDTPFLTSQTLSAITGANVVLKFENLQFTASFKERGALNKLSVLTVAERERGVITVSAGNHAQGVAYHASRLGIAATIVMPKTTPRVKVKAVQSFGATVVLAGSTFDEAAAEMRRIIAETGQTLVHPFDDAAIVAGQGTIALEMLAKRPDLDAIVTPVGGGGLISGLLVAAKGIKPDIEVIGVQSAMHPAMAEALGFKGPGATPGRTVAEGIAIAAPGALNRSILANAVDHMAVVEETLIEDAVALLLMIEKTLVEGAGAAGLAAILAEPERYRGRTIGIVLCGGNIDARVLNAVLQRHLIREGRLVRIRVNAPDSAGTLATLAGMIAEHGGDILDVRHERAFSAEGAKDTVISFDLELKEREALAPLRAAIAGLGWHVWVEGAHAAA
jgi:threonine dehydratase